MYIRSAVSLHCPVLSESSEGLGGGCCKHRGNGSGRRGVFFTGGTTSDTQINK